MSSKILKTGQPTKLKPVDLKINFTGSPVNGRYRWTFLYVDSSGRYNIFNFNGSNGDTAVEHAFPGDQEMNRRRLQLIGYENEFFTKKRDGRSIGGAAGLLQ